MARRRIDPVKADARRPSPSVPRTDLPVVTGPGVPTPYEDPALDWGPGSPVDPGPAEEPGCAVAAEAPLDPEAVLAEPPDARDISAELSAPPRRKLPLLTLLLCGGVVAGLAFTAGALVEKSQLQGSSRSGGPSFAAGRAGGSGGGAGGGSGAGRTFGGGTGGAVTVGTVKLVDGSTVYVTDAQGDTVKVTTAASTQVTEAEHGKVSDLQPGQTVTVRGSQNSSGDIAATTVSEGGLGGGLPGGGRGFGAAGTSGNGG